ncbi:MAG: riboflavin synthase [Alteromonadaceae bacterium]|jgi:riboflavin synthase
MFTGIVQSKGTVVSIQTREGLLKLVVSVPAVNLESLNIGASIAINGVCLTVTGFESTSKDVVGQVYFDIIDETLKLTNLGELMQRDQVNVERSVTFGTEIGGHIVSGHIQTTATITESELTADNCRMRLNVPVSWMKYILYKGFVSIDGASLTVGEVFDDGFNIHLIPETLQVTNLGQRQQGDRLNIEVDQQTYSIVKTVERVLAQQGTVFD